MEQFACLPCLSSLPFTVIKKNDTSAGSESTSEISLKGDAMQVTEMKSPLAALAQRIEP